MTLGEHLVALLEAHGVDTVFGIPGMHTVELYRGLARSSIRHVTPRHEQGAGFMADGYARVSGKPGVCLLITGPGLTNAITPMAQAYADSIPMLVISAVNRRGRLGHGEGELHESPNQQQIAAQVSAFSFRVLSPEDLPRAIARAFAVFSSGRPRPVHIEIPVDLFSAPVELPPPAEPVAIAPPRPAAVTIARAVDLCAKASRPVLLLGGGARAASREATQLAEALDAPAVMTTNARGILPLEHPLSVPASPSLLGVRELVADADLVIAVGTELGRTDYNLRGRDEFAVSAPLIRIDVDPLQLVRNHRSDVAVCADAKATLADLLEAWGDRTAHHEGAQRAEAARAAAWDELSAERHAMIDALHALRDLVPNAVFVGDSTQPVYAGNFYFEARSPGSWFNGATGFGALGYALPAAIGASVTEDDRPVICIVGDGGLQFSLMDLGTAVETGRPLLVIVWNNGGYGEIEAGMRRAGVDPIGVDLHTPDFTVLARGYGIRAERITTLSDLPRRAAALLCEGGPSLLEYDVG
ncbi:MAG: 5-guanidino-2-oxopentanoate decarboxylase [Myxococcota bacterium]